MALHPAVRRVLAVAASEIGYSRWKDDQQGTKYARETQPEFWPRDTWLLANGISFCDIFVTWVFWKALGEDFVTDGGLPAGASYNTDFRAAHGGRVPKSRAQPGDVLVFDWNWATLSTNHVGILEKNLASGNFQTIEGNTSPGATGSQGNGGGVYRRTRRPDQVRYVIRPVWSKAGIVPTGGASAGSSRPTSSTASTTPTAPAADEPLFEDVDKTQSWLTALGYDPGPIDGKWGARTEAATLAAQQDLGITPADGRPGPATRHILEDAVTQLAQIAADMAAIRSRTDRYLDAPIGDIPRKVLEHPVPLEGAWEGQTGTLAGLRAWYAEDMRKLRASIASAQTAAVTAVQQTGRAQGLTDQQIQAIATEVAAAASRVSAEDIAGQLRVTVAKGG